MEEKVMVREEFHVTNHSLAVAMGRRRNEDHDVQRMMILNVNY